MVKFELVTPIDAPPECLFDLSLSVEAHTNSMATAQETAVAGVRSGQLTLGDQVTWQARHFGVPWRMSAQITAWEFPHHFVDEQTRGPFAYWRHEHEFTPAESGGTVMVDRVEFKAPLGPLGRAAEVLVLRRYMIRLLRARNTYLAQEATRKS